MKRIIINADDLGFTKSKTEAIAACFKQGLITQTTLMCNMPFADLGLALAKENGFADRIGLHLNLTEGEPLTQAMADCRTFCDGGAFHGRWHRNRLHRFWIGRSDRDILIGEMRAQIERYLSFNLPLLHLDSHHHAHTDWAIARSLFPLVKEYGFRSMRLSMNLGIHGVLKEAYKAMLNRTIRGTGVVTTTWFASLSAIDGLLPCIPGNQDCSIELMAHPWYDDEGHLTDKLSSTSAPLIAGEAPGLRNLCSAGNARLCTYKDL